MAPSTKPRAAWIDTAKGLGILLVVLGHALGGLMDAGLLGPEGPAAKVFYAVYTFHMPLFFFLSGLFVQERLHADRGAFLRSALVRLLWPYLLWSNVQMLVISSLGGLVNRPAAFDHFRHLSILWSPVSQFWFLQVLLLFYATSWLLLPRLGLVALPALSIFTWHLPDIVDLNVVVQLCCKFFPFFAFGVCTRQLGATMEFSLAGVSSRAIGIVGLLLGAVWWLCAEATQQVGLSYWSTGAVPAALSGVAALSMLSRHPWVLRFAGLRWIGRRSMAIFVLHVLFVAGTRIVLHKLLDIDDATVILLCAVVAGVAGPLAVHALAARCRITGLVGLG